MNRPGNCYKYVLSLRYEVFPSNDIKVCHSLLNIETKVDIGFGSETAPSFCQRKLLTPSAISL
jgi:hypothetical protein